MKLRQAADFLVGQATAKTEKLFYPDKNNETSKLP